MEINTQEITLRQLVPAEGKVIKRIDPEEWYPEGVYLGKDEDINNYIEVDKGEMPEPPEEPEDVENIQV